MDFRHFTCNKFLAAIVGICCVLISNPCGVYPQDPTNSENLRSGLMRFAPPEVNPSAADGDLRDIANDGKPVRLTQSMIDSMAAQLGLDPNSETLQKLIDAYYRSANNPEQESEQLEDDAVPSDDEPVKPNILRHYRGKEGIPFPAKDEVPLPFKVTEENMRQAFTKHFEMVNEYVEKNTTPQIIPKCKINQTTREETGYEMEEKPDQVLADMLFIDKAEAPLDVKEVFGERVAVVRIPTDKGNFESIPALSIGVECMPFRWRVTRKYVFKDTGKNALKNYDKDAFGEGEFSEYMKAKLGLKD